MPYIHHRYYPLSPTIAAKTSQANATTTPWPVTQGRLHSVRIQIPSGHNGVTGIRITYLGQQIIPWSNNSYLVGSGDTFTLAWDAEIMPNGLAVVAFNTDLVPHQFWLLADITPDLGQAPGPHASPVDALAVPDSALAAVAAMSG